MERILVLWDSTYIINLFLHHEIRSDTSIWRYYLLQISIGSLISWMIQAPAIIAWISLFISCPFTHYRMDSFIKKRETHTVQDSYTKHKTCQAEMMRKKCIYPWHHEIYIRLISRIQSFQNKTAEMSFVTSSKSFRAKTSGRDYIQCKSPNGYISYSVHIHYNSMATFVA